MTYSLAKDVKYKKLQKTRFQQGIYNPLHPEKYMGDLRNIVYRSSYELKLMMKLDNNPAVIQWSSEETIIRYKSPVDNKMHRYFVDFKAIINTKDGVKTILIEVKPEKFTRPPVKPLKPTKSYEREVLTYMVNEAKWTAAKSYCEDRGFGFHILTEKDIF